VPPPAAETAETATDGTALLRAICKFPADDDPRLQYADWCSENGREEYGEFIRLQIELARMKHPDKHYHWNGRKDCDGCRAKPLRERERALWPSVSQQVIPTDLHGAVFGDDATMAQPTEEFNANARVVVRRGFVSEVRLPCAAFVGGHPCGRCGGSGSVLGPMPTSSSTGPHVCPACKGKRTVNGLAAALFAAHPVVSVSLVDKEPHWHGKGWAWYNPGRSRKSADVPTAAEAPAELLKPLRMEGDRFVLYASQEIAREAMSRAAVAFGRAKAGLEG
jgi:uncharacterized protein (TIGR02996 family)